MTILRVQGDFKLLYIVQGDFKLLYIVQGGYKALLQYNPTAGSFKIDIERCTRA